jgi:hypothetical protein
MTKRNKSQPSPFDPPPDRNHTLKHAPYELPRKGAWIPAKEENRIAYSTAPPLPPLPAKRGRKPGTAKFAADNRDLVDEVVRLCRRQGLMVNGACARLVDKIQGRGTPESRINQLGKLVRKSHPELKSRK